MLKNIFISIMAIIIVISGGVAMAQLDDHFGAAGVEGTKYLGQSGLSWYRDWNDSFMPENYPQPGKQKLWTVGKVDYRSDNLGLDWRWLILDLLEDTDLNFLEDLLNLCLAIVNQHIMPMIDEYWTENRPLLETTLEDTLNQFVYTDKKYGIKYKAECKYTDISFQDSLPDFNFSVKGDVIHFDTNLTVNWKTHIYIKAWVLNPNPFRWGYIWKSVGDADCKFKTTLNIAGDIGILNLGRERHIKVTQIIPNSNTESNIDWKMLGISFTWAELSNSVEDMIDNELEKAMTQELNKEPITTPFYFVDYFKSLFDDGVVPTQQEILDRIFDAEKKLLPRLVDKEDYRSQYWTIGYEPNWFPLFEPQQYAAYFVEYYRFIKAMDAKAKILGPSLFLTEAMENPGEIAFMLIPDIFKGLLTGIEEELKNLVVSYFQKADSKVWYESFLNALPADVHVDVNDFHIFPMKSDITTVDWDSVIYLMEDMAHFMQNKSHAEPVWVSEFGNIDWRRSEYQVADMCAHFCDYFKSNAVGIEKWFWYRSVGHAPFFDLPIFVSPAKTALLKNDFKLTQIGNMYLMKADNTPPIMVSAPTDEGDVTFMDEAIFNWEGAKEYDTGITDYHLFVKAEPGEGTVFDQWLGIKLTHMITFNAKGTLYAKVQAKNGAGLIGDWSPWSNGIIIKRTGVDNPTSDVPDDSLYTEKGHQPGASDECSEEDSSEVTLLKQGNELLKNTELMTIEIPTTFALSQNYPNPFNPLTYINYQLPQASPVIVRIFNTFGQEITTLVNEYQAAGCYTIQWDGRNEYRDRVVSGIYLYQIHAGNYMSTKKMILTK